MAHSQFDKFLREATYYAPGSDLIHRGDSFYSLYTSWCRLSGHPPEAEPAFREAMQERVTREEGLGMTGPAAVNYVVNNHQPIF